MELRHLRHFLAVADELHMGRAAARLKMAQPPLSQSIARLEKELGVRLFDRSNRRLILTRAGAALIDDARAAVACADAGVAMARAAADGIGGEIKIGFVSAALYDHLPDLAFKLNSEFPAVRPRYVELSTNEQIEAIARREIDLGFAHPPFGTGAGLQIRDLKGERFVAAVPEDDTRDEISLREIVQRGLILFPAGQGPVLHAQILDAFGRAGLAVPIVQEASRALTMLSLVSAGLGVALLPENTRRLDFKGVRFVEIGDGGHLPVMPLAQIAPRRPRPPIIDRVLSLLN